MQPPLRWTRHNETRISQTRYQTVRADTGQEHVGFPRKAASPGDNKP
jgi:hypothetical protein